MDQIIIGVDTHKPNHIAVAINTQVPVWVTLRSQQRARDIETWNYGVQSSAL